MKWGGEWPEISFPGYGIYEERVGARVLGLEEKENQLPASARPPRLAPATGKESWDWASRNREGHSSGSGSSKLVTTCRLAFL